MKTQISMTSLPVLRHQDSKSADKKEPVSRQQLPKSSVTLMPSSTSQLSEVQYLVDQHRKERAIAMKAAEQAAAANNKKPWPFGMFQSPLPRESKVQSPSKTSMRVPEMSTPKDDEAKENKDEKETPAQLCLRLKKQAITEMEISKNLNSIKKSWQKWGTTKKESDERQLSINERIQYGSHFWKLGAKMSRPQA